MTRIVTTKISAFTNRTRYDVRSIFKLSEKLSFFFQKRLISIVWHIKSCSLLIASLLFFIPDIGLGVRVFANGPGDLGSIPGRVIPKTQKMVLDASLLNTQHYKVRIKGKVEQSREGVAPFPTHWCSSYRKGSLRVTLDYGRQLYLLQLCFPRIDFNNHYFFADIYLYIYIKIHI